MTAPESTFEQRMRAVQNMINDTSDSLPDPWCGHCASWLEPTRPNGGHRAGCWIVSELRARLTRSGT